MAQGVERGGRGPETLWESMEVTGDLKSFLAAVLLPEREADGCESQKCHGGRKMSRWYTPCSNKFVKQGWLVERQVVSKQVFFWWSITIGKYPMDTPTSTEHRLKTTDEKKRPQQGS